MKDFIKTMMPRYKEVIDEDLVKLENIVKNGQINEKNSKMLSDALELMNRQKNLREFATKKAN